MKKTTIPVQSLWPQGNKISLVNGDSFNQDELLKKLGWHSIASSSITEPEKILVRQDGLKLFLNSDRLLRTSLYFSNDKFYGRDFFIKYGPRSSFNLKTHELLTNMEHAINAPGFKLSTSVYQDLVKNLKEEHQVVLGKEKEIVAVLEKELENVYSFDGVVKISSDLNGANSKVKHDVYGFQDYAFYKDFPWLIKISENFSTWYKKEPRKSLFLKRVLQVLLAPLYFIASIIFAFGEKNKHDSMYTRKLPESVQRTIWRSYCEFLESLRGELDKHVEKLPGYYRGDMRKIVSKSILLEAEFQFVLNPTSGFRLRLIDIDYDIQILSDEHTSTILNSSGENNSLSFNRTPFSQGHSWYSAITSMYFNMRARKLSYSSARKFLRLPLLYSLERAILASRELISIEGQVVSRASYEEALNEIVYTNVESTLVGVGLEKQWQEVLSFRSKIVALSEELGTIKHKVEIIKETRKEFSGLPFCFPEVVSDDKNVVSFHNLAPLHLLGRLNKDKTKNLELRDLRLLRGIPPLNGQIISITGQNGGGKTVVEMELIFGIYLAQMGFPVFAESFTLNPKDIVAMVFVERGEGSMLQLLMQKLKAVAEVVSSNPKNKVVVVIDELLTGTQEADGLRIGRQYLDMLKKHGCSVMFVSQITQLAEYAESSLNALCFHFDKKGNLQKGIGKGNADHLAEEVGLSQYLS